jgi:multicomponent Na+:H+ antiporter subunit F
MYGMVSILLLLAMSISMIRFLRGPTLSDRVVAFDVLGIMALSLLVILALYFKRSIYLDIALILGAIGFLGTTIFGRYIEKGI